MLGWQHIQYRDSRTLKTQQPTQRSLPRSRSHMTSTSPRPGDLAVAIHESWHATAASYFGFSVRSCAVRPLAHTDISMQFQPAGLAAAFDVCAELALLDMAATIGIVSAQAFAERKLLRQPHECHDASLIQTYL